jgi:hypothetical protein
MADQSDHYATDADPQLRNGSAQRTKLLYCGSTIACVAMVCATWGPESRVQSTIGFASMFLFQFWNFMKGDATHATATAAALAAKRSDDNAKAAREAARRAEERAEAAVIAAANAVRLGAAITAQIAKTTGEVKQEIKAADANASERSKLANGSGS